MDTGNFVSQKEFDYESFQKSNLLNFPSSAATVAALKNIHMVFCKGSKTLYHLFAFSDV